jgi:hypothetical protein
MLGDRGPEGRWHTRWSKSCWYGRWDKCSVCALRELAFAVRYGLARWIDPREGVPGTAQTPAETHEERGQQ